MNNLKPAMLVRKHAVKNMFGEISHAVLQLRGGAKGTGKIIAQTDYWPNQSVSSMAAEDLMFRRAQDQGYEIVGFSYKEWED